jgi:RAB protein geranylgeranyltransferase component A
LSRSGKTVLHVDRNDYYGGNEAALSLSDAETWVSKHAKSTSNTSTKFSNATLSTSTAQQNDQNKLAHSRAYSLALAPQLLYTRSSLLPALVSSQTHNQLEFQAVGSWFVVSKAAEDAAAQAKLTRVPGGREDVFQDSTLDLKAKRNLMKFLRFVAKSEEQKDSLDADRTTPISSYLSEQFELPEASHAPIVALTLSRQPLQSTTVDFAIPRIARHLGSIGLFGPGFGAVVPKWGGLAEIAQVACRACAVGGGVYVLGKSVDEVIHTDDSTFTLRLGEGEKVTGKWLVGDDENLPASAPTEETSAECVSSESISIVSSPLTSLFPSTSEGGPTPAGAVILVSSGTDTAPPIHIFVHSTESGECPVGQSTYELPCRISSAQRNDERLLRILIYIV